MVFTMIVLLVNCGKNKTDDQNNNESTKEAVNSATDSGSNDEKDRGRFCVLQMSRQKE